MLLFAHTGITLGLALAWDKGLGRPFPSLLKKAVPKRISIAAQAIDYRLVLIGSLLPDVIDKPIGHLFFPETFGNNGRIFAHTLLFFLLLLSYGLFRFYQHQKNGMLVLALCSGLHLVLDGMWRSIHTLFWPAMGWQFPGTDLVDLKEWLEDMGEAAKTEPIVYVTEAIGILVLIIFASQILKNKQLLHFIKRGTIE